jgi:hypothetical protein
VFQNPLICAKLLEYFREFVKIRVDLYHEVALADKKRIWLRSPDPCYLFSYNSPTGFTGLFWVPSLLIPCAAFSKYLVLAAFRLDLLPVRRGSDHALAIYLVQCERTVLHRIPQEVHIFQVERDRPTEN